jgi:3-hydroxyisobutyrate dehydrogenase-like beta-hydroxyacid dehydrogenase
VRIAVFGLGEAGGLIAADLAARGVEVAGYDPAPVADPVGVRRCVHPAEAVAGADFVLGITAAADAATALGQALDEIPTRAVYADFATAAPRLKQELAARAAARRLPFVDVALMAPVPGKGLATPAGISGNGAASFEAVFVPLGMPVERVGEVAGEAALRKLLRSVMMKGLAALLIEAMRAGRNAGVGDWLWQNMVHQLAVADGPLLARLVSGTKVHALRRLHEMEAAEALLNDLGVDPVMTRSTVESLRRIPSEELPVLPGSEED